MALVCARFALHGLKFRDGVEQALRIAGAAEEVVGFIPGRVILQRHEDGRWLAAPTGDENAGVVVDDAIQCGGEVSAKFAAGCDFHR